MARRVRFYEDSVQYNYVRSRELEGSMNAVAKTGVYLITAMRIRTGWGRVSETRWPYSGRVWPPVYPTNSNDLDSIASYNRILGFTAIRDVGDARAVLANGIGFQLAIPITEHWRKPNGGVIPLPLSVTSTTFGDIHAIAIIGFDDTKRLFRFRNSWGVGWGDSGYGYLPYSYMTLYMFEAWSEIIYKEPLARVSGDGFSIGRFRLYNVLGYPTTIFTVFDNATRDKVGWCLATIRDGYLDVEEFFVKPSYEIINPSINLALEVHNEAHDNDLPIRFWLSHCDCSPGAYNHVPPYNAAMGLGLRVRRSRQRWAAEVAM